MSGVSQYALSRMALPVRAGWVLWAAVLPDPQASLEDMDVTVHQIVGWIGGEPLIKDSYGNDRESYEILPPDSVRVFCSPDSEVPSMESLYAMLKERR